MYEIDIRVIVVSKKGNIYRYVPNAMSKFDPDNNNAPN